MRQKIKEILQSCDAPIVFASTHGAPQEELYLCQFAEEFHMQGTVIPKGAYILADIETLDIIKCYIMNDSISKENIKAFVLPYAEGSTESITLDDSADLMVTSILTGCTFVAELNTPTPTVLHINKQYISGEDEFGTISKIDQPAIDKEIETKMSGKSCFTLKKEDYNPSDLEFHSATIIGIRGNGSSWEYYSQYISSDYSSGVYKVTPGKQLTLSSTGLTQFSVVASTQNIKKTEKKTETTSTRDKNTRCTIV